MSASLTISLIKRVIELTDVALTFVIALLTCYFYRCCAEIVLLYDANTHEYLGLVGDPTSPACPYEPRYIDTDDDSFSIVISQKNANTMVLTQWTYYPAP